MNDALPRLFGRYLLLKQLGQGGMGTVYFARSLGASKTPLVIKTLRADHNEVPEYTARFRHEATIAVSVDSPHVVKIFDVGETSGTFYLAMELIAGWPLTDVVGAFQREKKQMPIALALAFVRDALLGLEALHDAKHPETREPLGVVHRDISPKNLMITAEGRAVVIDLGLGRSNVQEWQTRAGYIMGTPGYISPEQAGGQAIDHRSDLWALGAVLYELLLLEHFIPQAELAVMVVRALRPAPFIAPSSQRADVPVSLDALVERTLSLIVEDRPASARAMIEAIDAIGVALPEDRTSMLPASLRERLSLATIERQRLIERSVLELDPPPEDTRLIATRTDMLVSANTELVPQPAPARAGIPIAWLAVCVAVLAIGLAIAIVRSTKYEAPAFVEQALPNAVPRATALPVEQEPIVDAKPERAPRELTKRAIVAQPAPPVERPAAPPELDSETLLRQLLREASAMRKQHPDRAKAIDEIITDASLWTGSKDPPRAVAALRALEQRLRELDTGL